jgi:hypothetical protein
MGKLSQAPAPWSHGKHEMVWDLNPGLPAPPALLPSKALLSVLGLFRLVLAVLGFELGAFTMSRSPAHFYEGFFLNRVS